MYSLNDIFQLLQYQVSYVLQYFPYILLHFFMLFSIRFVLLVMLSKGIFCLAGSLRKYEFSFLLLMLISSLLVSIFLLVTSRGVFYLGNDFVFLSGVLLGGRRGFPLLMINWLFLSFYIYFESRDVAWVSYMLFDTTIHFLIGLTACGLLYNPLGEYSWGEIFFICLNKIMACVVSAACWLIMMHEEWLPGFNILLFRLVVWPLVSFPVIFLFMFFMKQDACLFTASAAKTR